MPNHLISATSPYLIRHAASPVDWFPWVASAFEIASRENKPIFLTIGDSANHASHVMQKESFEDPEIAEILNREFLSILVDREEMPELEAIYQPAGMAITGQSASPFLVFLTPNKQPFYSGTYFPPLPRYRKPSFRMVLLAIAQTWKENRSLLIRSADKLTAFISRDVDWNSSPDSLTRLDRNSICENLNQTYDWRSGGWGDAPKFFNPITIELLLMIASDNPSALKMAVHALNSMQSGGFFDSIGGGFHRSSTDPLWRVPHYEKVLSDNAQAALAYLHAYLHTGIPTFKRTCEKTLDFVIREMTHPLGGFYSSLDSDLAEEEGLYYQWDIQELKSIFRTHPSRAWFYQVFKIMDTSNSNEKIVISRSQPPEKDSQANQNAIEEMLAALLQQRNLRVPPAIDDKIIVAWNALTIRALAEAGRFLNRPDYLRAAQTNAHFLLDNLYANNHLFRIWRSGTSYLNARLEDYSALILGLLALVQSDANFCWLQTALQLASTMIESFSSPSGFFYDAPPTVQSDLLFNPITCRDSAIPGGNAMAAQSLIRLTAYSTNPDGLALAQKLTASMAAKAIQSPLKYSTWLQNAVLIQSG